MTWEDTYPVIVAIRDNKDYTKVLLCSYYATITRWGVLLRHTFSKVQGLVPLSIQNNVVISSGGGVGPMDPNLHAMGVFIRNFTGIMFGNPIYPSNPILACTVLTAT